jgi:peptidoglycan L-alanyl-D-glutamate endopeptidase CwlK
MGLSDAQIKRNEDAIKTLLPEVQQLCRNHLGQCQQAGIDLLIVQALRTKDEQDALYAQGRTKPGKVVTNAQYGYSWHCFGRAYDVAIIEGGQPIWESPKYAKVGALGKLVGLAWGGDFKAIKGDLGHFEFHPGMDLAQARKEAGLK